MADEISEQSATQNTEAASSSTPGQPRDQLEVEEGVQSEDNITYPSGHKLWLTTGSVAICSILIGLDMTIVAVAVPSLTNQFKTVADIGWYSSVYGIMAAAFIFFFGKMYTVFSVKYVYMASLAIFESGSLLCTTATSSNQFIAGRALAGLGASGLNAGFLTIITHSFPLRKRPLFTGIINAGGSIALVSAPIIGGALIDAFNWRACFGLNLPLGAIALVLIAFGFRDPVENPDTRLPFGEKFKKIDLIGTVVLVPSITCLMLAMQWGGIRYGWGDVRVIILLVLFGALLAIFAYLQYRFQERATLPPRILKNRSILAGAWYNACCNGTLAITEYYISIYFQGIKGYSATKSGLLGIPMLVGLSITALAGSAGITLVGYYTPFMFATTLLAPIAAGLLTTVEIDSSLIKVLALLGFLGASVGIGMQGPLSAAQTVMTAKDAPIGLAVVIFGASIGSSLFLSASAALFQNRLVDEIQKHSPGTNAIELNQVGLSDLRDIVGSGRLKDVLLGYDEAVTQTLYLPVALTVATIIGSALTEWRSVKKKQS